MSLDIWNQVKKVPEKYKKPIKGGRLNGMSSINPMWRIQKLTDVFGPCGIGWYTSNIEQRLEAGASGEIVAIVNLLLYIKDGDKWSEGIFGTGGSLLVAAEKNGLHTSDEAFKMAYTDALSVACKALGIGADVYLEEDSTKYDVQVPSFVPRVENLKKTQSDVFQMLYPGTIGTTLGSPDVEMIAAKDEFMKLSHKPGDKLSSLSKQEWQELLETLIDVEFARNMEAAKGV